VPWWHAVLGRALDVAVRAQLRGFQEARVAREAVGRAEAVERPRQPARPGGIAAVALVRRLPQKLARLQVEDPLVSGAAVAAKKGAARGQAVLRGDLAQCGVVRLLRGVENDADVHHNVDEE